MLLCVVLPRDILDEIRFVRASSFGYLSGFHSKKEQLWVVLKANQSTRLSNLYLHRSQGDFYEKLVVWVKVRRGFKDALSKNLIPNLNTLASWFLKPKQVPPLDGAQVVLFVEPDGTCCCRLVLATEAIPFEIIPMWLQIVDWPLDIQQLNDGLVPLRQLKQKHVVLVGVGSGGSQLALALAAAGVGFMTLFDPDRLEQANLFRHLCDIADVGRFKVDAVADRIKAHGLQTEVVSQRVDIVEQPAAFYEAVGDCDLLICATDTVSSRALANFAAVSLRKPLLVAGTYEAATIGEIVMYYPGGACFECVRRVLRRAGAMEVVTSSNELLSLFPYARLLGDEPHARGTRVDVTIVANLAARIAIGLLANGPSFLPTSYVVWGSISNHDLPSPFDFELPLTLKYVSVDRQKDCPVCGDYLNDPEGEKVVETILSTSENR